MYALFTSTKFSGDTQITKLSSTGRFSKGPKLYICDNISHREICTNLIKWDMKNQHILKNQFHVLTLVHLFHALMCSTDFKDGCCSLGPVQCFNILRRTSTNHKSFHSAGQSASIQSNSWDSNRLNYLCSANTEWCR